MIGYISDNLLLPILDFFYGLVPSYGLAIIALTVVIRLALFPLSAGSIRNARRMRIAQPVMQKRQADIRSKFANNPQKQQEELGKVMKEFGSPLAGCLPLVVQMPILFALFATLRGSPFADVPYTFNVKVVPADLVAAVEAKPFTSASHSIFINETNHIPVVAALPGGNRLGVGEQAKVLLQTKDGSESLEAVEERLTPTIDMSPQWNITKGEGVVSIASNGTVTALTPGDATVEVKIPGLAARSGFLFIKALGQVGIRTDGQVNWDIAGLVAGFGISLFVSQILSGWGMPANPQQATANKITPVMITGMFLFFPLPAGVLLYMVIANIFQAFQTFVLIREPLPENLQAILDQQMTQQTVTASATAISSERMPFEPKGKR
ncbi:MULTISPECIES: membrane protein insertase YidC [unclassified Synechococcus]|uniref:membrane protein insertase YidC n=1 Tax=unclassified Synechococcus TaxID=2626047 RepID=UPI001A1BF629|nr:MULTISPECIES: membrane protein insertase YidC [unclassified Synechococcus]MBJ7363947.1 membrane protein insertase YidC [Synechococcus sp. SupBloom_Metag_053]MCX5929724.1 membrane protein insertase YidC [Synechococcus sp. LacPavin_0920_WC12_MAG_50_7]MDA0291174.1 membrane protein insertase YidC [Cyanobacteriota bacterium]MCP9939264.1 membrane protein insertase YidC [Synechococcus sp. Cruz CV12-2-Slac-r]MDA1169760.1 membrane protein insertase YidC [Cyanobacteriota bacterium]